MFAGKTEKEALTSEDFFIHIEAGGKVLSKISCHWRFSKFAPGVEDTSPFFRCLDLFISVTPTAHDEDLRRKPGGSNKSLCPSTNGTALEHLVRTCYNKRATPIHHTLDIATKIVLVARDGYLCRRDILELRMRHSQFVEYVIPFLNDDNYYASIDRSEQNHLASLLVSSPGALLVKEQDVALCSDTPTSLDQDIMVRLSFNWILPTRLSKRKVAMVGGRSMFDKKNLGFCYKGPYEAAEALGISVIVVDMPGHWLQNEAYSHLRDEFVAIDMTIDGGLPSRIAEAVNDKEIDGIVAFADEFVDPTVQAAEKLGLPTDPVLAYLQSLDKYATRRRFNPNTQAIRLDNAGELDEPSMASMVESLRYPMIVKPSRGGGSRGVMKVNNWASLRQAVRRIEEWGYSRQGILVETYADGPEVDANFALWKGKILFFEMCDDFPSFADAQDATSSDNFAESNMVLPSFLVPREKNLVRSALHRTLLQLGFHSGVFHVEARIQNSAMRYRKTNGIVDLDSVDTELIAAQSHLCPEVFLIEVNPRPAGFDSVYATAYTYGVDFNGLHWLRALDDEERFAALCQPFTCDAQYFSCILVIPVHRERIHVPEDFFADVLRQLPDVTPYVSRTECFTGGKVISPVGGAGEIGSFLVYSRTSRRNLLEMCERIKKVAKDMLDRV